MDESLGQLTRQFLEWIAAQPRTYREAMDAWRTTCPRLTVWEDALSEGLIQLDGQGCTMNQARVALTAKGRAILDERDSRRPRAGGDPDGAQVVSGRSGCPPSRA